MTAMSLYNDISTMTCFISFLETDNPCAMTNPTDLLMVIKRCALASWPERSAYWMTFSRGAEITLSAFSFSSSLAETFRRSFSQAVFLNTPSRRARRRNPARLTVLLDFLVNIEYLSSCLCNLQDTRISGTPVLAELEASKQSFVMITYSKNHPSHFGHCLLEYHM